MNRKQKDVLLYSVAMIAALVVSLYVSPVWGGAVLFWLGIATAIFFVFAIFGAAFGHKLNK